MSKIRILFLASNPNNTELLRLPNEAQLIDAALRSSELRDQFEFRTQFAVRISDLQELLLRYRPHIVHISGHGEENGIVLENRRGEAQVVSVEDLTEMFKLLKDNIRCVILNACFTNVQAKRLSESIDSVIGISERIQDLSSIEFASAFYLALGYGKSIQEAFQLGCNRIGLEGLPDGDRLNLFRRDPLQSLSFIDILNGSSLWFYLNYLANPVVLGLLMTLVLIGVIGYWILNQPEQISLPMPANHYNIAIASFVVGNLDAPEDGTLQADLQNDAERITEEIYSYLSEHKQELASKLPQKVNILPPSQLKLETLKASAIEQVADEINANLLIYGVLTQTTSAQWVVEPRYFVANRSTLERARDVTGEYILGKSIRFLPGNPEEFSRVAQIIHPRIDTLLTLIDGLSLLDQGTIEGSLSAGEIFCNTPHNEPSNDETSGADLLWLFCGHSKTMLMWLQRSNPSASQKLANEALTAYRNALEANPEQIRATISLAALSVAINKPGIPPYNDCSSEKLTNLNEASQMLARALQTIDYYHSVPGSTILGALLNRAHAHFWLGICAERIEPDWERAIQLYQEVITTRNVLKGRPDLLDFPTAEAYTQLGFIDLWAKWVNDQMPSEAQIFRSRQPTLLQDAITNYEAGLKHLLAMQENTQVAEYTVDIASWAVTAFCLGKRDDLVAAYLKQFSEKVPGWSLENMSKRINSSIKKECGL